MGSVTMSFSSSGRATSTYNVQWYNDNIVTSFPLGTKVTTVDLIINYGLCNDSSSSGDHDISVQLEAGAGGQWYEIWSGTLFLSGRNGDGTRDFGTIAIPSAYQETFARTGVADVRVYDDEESGLLITATSNGTATFTYDYDLIVTVYPPTVSQNSNGQYVVSWPAASLENGTGNVTYSLYYGPNNTLAYSGTSRGATITIPSDYYGISIPFTVVAEYSGITDYATTYFTANYPSVSAPSNLKINGSDSYTGQNIPLTWSASTLSYIDGTITYGILVNGSQFDTTTETSYTISEETAKD